MEKSFQHAGLSVRRNDPYKGGYITEHYGSLPRVAALQVEMRWGLYLDEMHPDATPTHARFGAFKSVLSDVFTRLLADIKERCPIRGYAIDVGVVAGFKKTYSFFPLDELQTVAKLAALPSAPPGLAAVGETFGRYGLDRNVTMVGIDHQHETMNVYFGRFDTELVEASTVQKMLADLGLPAASDEALDFIRRAFAIYFTIGWDEPKAERICYAVITRDPRLLPARKDPEIARFADGSAVHDDERIMTYGITVGPGGESYKLGTYFRMAPETRRLLAAFDAID